jgi:hypothetical protein
MEAHMKLDYLFTENILKDWWACKEEYAKRWSVLMYGHDANLFFISGFLSMVSSNSLKS